MRKRTTFWIIAIVVVPVLLLTMYFFLLNNRPGKPGPLPERIKGELRIGTLNVCWMAFNKDASVTADVIAASAQQNDLDILLLQEYKPHWNFDEKAFRAVFRGRYKYVSIEDECVCISRYPLKSHKRVRFEDMSDNFSDIVVSLPGGKEVEIFCVHLITTGINNFMSEDIPLDVAEIGAAGTFLGNSAIRKNQAVSLAHRVEKVARELIVAGDFNCVPGMAPYRQMLSASLKDSFLSAGKGKGSTYRGFGDLFRIDYIFYGPGLECLDSRVVDDGTSDHKMVVGSFVFAGEEVE
ncbi:MAG: endonuclease/exonuclease/phosphatase family protein [Candidatus Cryptobacteroides sp.]